MALDARAIHPETRAVNCPMDILEECKMRIKDMPLTPRKSLPRTRICLRCGYRGEDVHSYWIFTSEGRERMMLCDSVEDCNKRKYGEVEDCNRRAK